MRQTFAPVENSSSRPRWSVMIAAHNSGKFLQTALRSVLAQDLGAKDMQIEVVDDMSDDDPAAIVNALGGGRVDFFRHDRRLGQIGNLSACVARAKGEIVHLLHADDYVMPGFYGALDRAFTNDAEIGAAFCRWIVVDADDQTLSVAGVEQEHPGRLENALERLATEQRIVTPSIAVRRSVWERLGGFDSRLLCAEDWEMWVRIAANYPIWYEPAQLAAYRRHQSSTSARNSRNAKELHYTGMAIGMFAPLLPSERRQKIVRRARQTYARIAIARSLHYARLGDWSAALSNFRVAAKLDTSLRAIVSAAYSAIRQRWAR